MLEPGLGPVLGRAWFIELVLKIEDWLPPWGGLDAEVEAGDAPARLCGGMYPGMAFLKFDVVVEQGTRFFANLVAF